MSFSVSLGEFMHLTIFMVKYFITLTVIYNFSYYLDEIINNWIHDVINEIWVNRELKKGINFVRIVVSKNIADILMLL